MVLGINLLSGLLGGRCGGICLASLCLADLVFPVISSKPAEHQHSYFDFSSQIGRAGVSLQRNRTQRKGGQAGS
jgi:hypothetical protein